jgi:hypothetical protein
MNVVVLLDHLVGDEGEELSPLPERDGIYDPAGEFE